MTASCLISSAVKRRCPRSSRWAFGGAYGGGVLPAHQSGESCLAPPLAPAQRAKVRAGDGGLPFWDLVYATAPSRGHASSFFYEYREDRFPAVFRVPAPVRG
jgi:hypothetical protein